MLTPEALFSIVNLVPLPGWLLLIVVPRHHWTTLIAGRVIPLLLAAIYLGILVTHWSVSLDSFSSLQRVSDLFANRWAVLAGWVHYLAFDLIVGEWENRDALACRVSRWLVVPCLLLTFMFGPIGFLAYAIVRTTGRSPVPGDATSNVTSA